MNICFNAILYDWIQLQVDIFFIFFSMGVGGVRGRPIIAEMNLTKNVS